MPVEQLNEQLTDGEVEKMADVLCLLFDPFDPESLELVESIDQQHSRAIPRLYVGLQCDSEVSTDKWTAVKQAKPSACFVDDIKSTGIALNQLVHIATRPYVMTML